MVRPVGDVAPKETPKVIFLKKQLHEISRKIAEAQRQNKIRVLEKLSKQKDEIENKLSTLGF